MTAIRKPAVRETAVCVGRRPLVVTLHPRFLVLREKGRRAQYTVEYDVVYDLARKLAARVDMIGRW
jgi:hypothetical protein